MIDVQTRRARHQHPAAAFVGIEKSLEKSLPTAVFVDFIENDYRRVLVQFLQPRLLGHGIGTRQNEVPVRFIVPIEIDRPQLAAKRGFPDLAGSGDKSHLPMLCNMALNQVPVNSRTVVHAD